jgi:dTMP kinase
MIGSRAERERLQQFVVVWTRLKDETSRPGAVVIVEGEKDRRSLVRLGLSSPIALIHRGQRLPSIAQSLAAHHTQAVVLTDWDRKGGQLAERISELLEGADIEVDRETRQRLARVLRGELVHVEGLYRWANHLAESVGTVLAPMLDEGVE